MSRNRLCVVTAITLAFASTALMIARYQVLGLNMRRSHGPDTWKITMLVQGKSSGEARIVTAAPLENARQHVVSEKCVGDEFTIRPHESAVQGVRRGFLWSQRPGIEPGQFRVRYECFCTVAVTRAPIGDGASDGPLQIAPKSGEYLRSEPGIATDDPTIANRARILTEGIDRPADQAQSLFRFVEQDIASEPSISGASPGAIDCLKHAAGDSAGKARLLAALCRNCGIPARLVTGLTLTKDDEQLPHVWVEAWLRDHWLPMCPFYHHFGHTPRTYLTLGYGDVRLVHGRNVRNLSCAFHVERMPLGAVPAADASPAQRWFTRMSLYSLPPAEQRLTQFLLLMPVAALVICVLRNVIGIASFGTFGPALVGLVFREQASLGGILVFVGLILVGWRCRRLLDRFHLLQVPRTALMLSLIIVLLIAVVAAATHFQVAITQYVSLFPIIILTGMVERFWTLEAEDGARSSFRTMIGTLFISTMVAVVVSIHWISESMFNYPEALGLVMAGQLLLGRYTGFRVSELYRFRDFVEPTLPEIQVERRTLPMRRF